MMHPKMQSDGYGCYAKNKKKNSKPEVSELLGPPCATFNQTEERFTRTSNERAAPCRAANEVMNNKNV